MTVSGSYPAIMSGSYHLIWYWSFPFIMSGNYHVMLSRSNALTVSGSYLVILSENYPVILPWSYPMVLSSHCDIDLPSVREGTWSQVTVSKVLSSSRCWAVLYFRTHSVAAAIQPPAPCSLLSWLPCYPGSPAILAALLPCYPGCPATLLPWLSCPLQPCPACEGSFPTAGPPVMCSHLSHQVIHRNGSHGIGVNLHSKLIK